MEELTYFKVYDWYRIQLKLSGNSLNAFAIIDNFTQAKGMYEGSISGLSERLGITRANATKIVDKLVQQGLVEKLENNPVQYRGGVSYPYRSIVKPCIETIHTHVSKRYTPMYRNDTHPCIETIHDIKDTIKEDIKKDRKDINPFIFQSFSSLSYPSQRKKDDDVYIFQSRVMELALDRQVSVESATNMLVTAIDKYIDGLKGKQHLCKSLGKLLSDDYDDFILCKIPKDIESTQNVKDYMTLSCLESSAEYESMLTTTQLDDLNWLYDTFNNLNHYDDGWIDYKSVSHPKDYYFKLFYDLMDEYPNVQITNEFDRYMEALKDTNCLNFMEFGYFLREGWRDWKYVLYPSERE